MTKLTLTAVMLHCETVYRMLTVALDQMKHREGRRREDAMMVGTVEISCNKLHRLLQEFKEEEVEQLVEDLTKQFFWTCPQHDCPSTSDIRNEDEGNICYHYCPRCNAWWVEIHKPTSGAYQVKMSITPTQHAQNLRESSPESNQEGCPACGNALKKDGRCTVCSRSYQEDES